MARAAWSGRTARTPSALRRRYAGPLIGDHQFGSTSGSTWDPPGPSRPGGLHFAALSSRLSTARASPRSRRDLPRLGRHRTPIRCGDGELAPAPARRSRTYRRARARLPPASSRVRSTKSPTSVDSSSICAMTSSAVPAISSSGSSAGTGLPDAISSSTLVRSDVSGVRSSWPASVTRRRLSLPRFGRAPPASC